MSPLPRRPCRAAFLLEKIMSIRKRRKRPQPLMNKPAVKRDEGTLQTRIKLRYNPLADLPQELQEAAQNLRDTWVTVSGPARGRGASFERIHTGSGGLKRGDGNIWWWASLALYRSWYEEMARLKLPTKPVTAIVADDALPQEVLIPQLGYRHSEQIMGLVGEGLRIFSRLWNARPTDFS